MKNKTWDEFWGEFLQITFHLGHPDLWPARERKAKWFLQATGLQPGSSILDLGCGDGMIDVWLSRMGHSVTAVDRTITVIEKARQIDDTKKVKFIAADLKEIVFQSDSFDAVLFTEASGLINRKGVIRAESSFDESTRIQNIQFYFTPHGEEEFGIYEPYDLENADQPGIIRYLYPLSEISLILQRVGFTTTEIGHYYEKNYFAILAGK